MITDYIDVLDPTSQPRVARNKMAPRPDTLEGKVVGLLWNRKPNGDILLDRFEESLRARFSLKDVLRGAKPSGKGGGSWPASAELLDEMAATCHLVVNAVGD